MFGPQLRGGHSQVDCSADVAGESTDVSVASVGAATFLFFGVTSRESPMDDGGISSRPSPCAESASDVGSPLDDAAWADEAGCGTVSEDSSSNCCCCLRPTSSGI